eukprot:scaffold3256_cov95-Pinguiococcus_pyrenoidosus.AAC.1
MIAPGGMSLAALLGGFFYWQASQSIAGVFYNRISREVELLVRASRNTARRSEASLIPGDD